MRIEKKWKKSMRSLSMNECLVSKTKLRRETDEDGNKVAIKLVHQTNNVSERKDKTTFFIKKIHVINQRRCVTTSKLHRFNLIV